MRQKLSNEKEKEICDIYRQGNLPYTKVAQICNVERKDVARVTRKRGATGIRVRREYPIDESLFEKIDSEWKAYFLGWLYSDGCMTKTGSGVTLSLSEKDKVILDYFNNIIYGGKRPLYPRKERFNTKTGSTTKKSFAFTIYNRKICSDLVGLGVIPQKSFTVQWPTKIPDALMSHFIRGIFEGDGSVRLRENKYLQILFLGSLHLMENLRRYLKEKLDIDTFLTTKLNIYALNCYRSSHTVKLMNFMQKDAEMFLERKRLYPTQPLLRKMR